MQNRTFAAFFASAVAIATAAPVAAQQVFGASGYITVSMAGLGNTTTVAGDSRIPILARDVEYNPGSGTLHVRATGRRGAVRQVDIDVRQPRTGARFEFGAQSTATLRVHLEDGAELAAESGRGFIGITTLDEHHVVGTYEGTFAHGAVPVVIRGRFEAAFPVARANGAGGATAAPAAGSTAGH
jgi:hypothetical protein